jgi:hypothetical protein
MLEGIFGASVLAFFCWSGLISWLIGRLPLKDAVSAEQETNDRNINTKGIDNWHVPQQMQSSTHINSLYVCEQQEEHRKHYG